jgi:hypothetical protein
MDIDERYKYLRMMRARYQEARRKERTHLLDEMEEMTGLGRKHLILRMNSPGPYRRGRRRERSRKYGVEVEKAVSLIADTLDWICAERLKPALPKMATHLAKFGEMETTPSLLSQLGEISVSTLRRMLLRIERPCARLPQGRQGRRPDTLAQAMVPINVISWKEGEPGHFEVDLVHHSRSGIPGPFACTIQFLDVLTGWSERLALPGHDFDAIWQALQLFKAQCPIPARQIHTDNGSEFMNHALVSHFPEVMGSARFTRGLPGYKNHNRFVEQKNGSLVRAYLHDLYLFTSEHVDMLNALYADMRIYYNCFQPVLRQVARHALVYPDGICRIIRRQDTAKTPLERLLVASPPLPRETAQELRHLYTQTNPRTLKHRIHDRLNRLYQISQRDERSKALYAQ